LVLEALHAGDSVEHPAGTGRPEVFQIAQTPPLDYGALAYPISLNSDHKKEGVWGVKDAVQFDNFFSEGLIKTCVLKHRLPAFLNRLPAFSR
jgi:hypothetical protein